MGLRQSKRSLTFPPRPLGEMFCKSEGLIQSGVHIRSYCDDAFAMKLCLPIRTSRYRDVLYRFHHLSGPTLQFPFGRGDWNLADAYTDAAPHFRRVFFSRFFGCTFLFVLFRNPIGIAFFLVE